LAGLPKGKPLERTFYSPDAQVPKQQCQNTNATHNTDVNMEKSTIGSHNFNHRPEEKSAISFITNAEAC